MIEHAHEDHEVERLSEPSDVVDREIAKLDIELIDLGGKPRLRQIFFATVESENAVGPSALHLHRIKSGIASDVQNRLSFQRFGHDPREIAPLHRRVVAEKM